MRGSGVLFYGQKHAGIGSCQFCRRSFYDWDHFQALYSYSPLPVHLHIHCIHSKPRTCDEANLCSKTVTRFISNDNSPSFKTDSLMELRLSIDQHSFLIVNYRLFIYLMFNTTFLVGEIFKSKIYSYFRLFINDLFIFCPF